MTATDVGLPSGPMVNGRNLTPEWLHALGDIERLESLKAEHAKIADAPVTAMTDALDAAEMALAAALDRIVPNNIVATVLRDFEVSGATVEHGLGTMAYIPMISAVDTAGDGRTIVSPVTAYMSANMPRKDTDAWSQSGFGATGDRRWITFTISTLEGIPQ